jgi:signal transduction histidine kinase
MLISICIRCSSKDCEKSEVDTFDFCQYGVAFYNKGNNEIKKKEESVTLRHISHNLRHELNKILQIIVMEASQLDPTVSAKKIELDKPASKIIGATVIIDQFIEMIAGVNEFHSNPNYSANLDKKSNLLKLLDKYSKIFSLVTNTRRAKNIVFNCGGVSDKTNITFASQIVEYLVSIIMDNVWKYSVDGSVVIISSFENDKKYIDLKFENTSGFIIDHEMIFKKGFQSKKESEGFGYGLYWANVLIQYYNELSNRTSDCLELTHEQQVLDAGLAKQIFIIRNLRA